MIVLTGPEVLVAYERTGGFAGIEERVTVDVSGTADVNGRRIAVGDAEMRGLRDALGRVVTTRSSAAGCAVADHFTYTLAYRGHRTTRCRLPSDWRAAVERLEALARRAGQPDAARACRSRIAASSDATGPSTRRPGATSWTGRAATGPGGTPSSSRHAPSCADEWT